jgi:hypothetical protein
MLTIWRALLEACGRKFWQNQLWYWAVQMYFE